VAESYFGNHVVTLATKNKRVRKIQKQKFAPTPDRNENFGHVTVTMENKGKNRLRIPTRRGDEKTLGVASSTA
jgi:hypothetical protein